MKAVTDKELDDVQQKVLEAMTAIYSVQVRLEMLTSKLDQQLRVFRETQDHISRSRGAALQKAAELDGAIVAP